LPIPYPHCLSSGTSAKLLQWTTRNTSRSWNISNACCRNQQAAENGWRYTDNSKVPRKRESWESIRAKQLQQETIDRRIREKALAELPPAPESPTQLPDPSSEQQPEAFDTAAWQLNCRITSLMRAKFGPNWARHRAHHRLAERALLDLKGQGDGKALRNLRNSSGNGSYELALRMKHGE